MALTGRGNKGKSMAVKLRLMRMGKTKQPTYRLVAADSRSPRDGRFIEIVGSYAPRQAGKQGRPEGRAGDTVAPGRRPADGPGAAHPRRRRPDGSRAGPPGASHQGCRSGRPGREGQVSDPYNRAPGGRARAVLEYLARQIVDEPDAVGVETSGGQPRPSGAAQVAGGAR